MNAVALTANPTSDYRAAMQQAAVAYLYRGEHLAGDAQVLENCSRYLLHSLEVPEHLVQRIAELAVAEFENMTIKRLAWLGIYPSSGPYRPLIWLLDTKTQQRHPVPARFLPTHLLQTRNTSK
ncbi:hypothetical protein HFV04_017015 [Pseudomonas sp. BIGb0427]|uniref:hypothetical protein n=1 Tax=Pseudomonas sp. BIGb0427 TaxID=2724470 RepID=UPI0016AE527F|nr:hypothetical protein [Pseudomonas sp. BIGb0427]NLU60046.1 hypothetical protein [Pseudomonas sp. BIGb0427]QPG61220.1 hypothetical protein HFV04_017015 [Pseudomonas sp. BIGb0427]